MSSGSTMRPDGVRGAGGEHLLAVRERVERVRSRRRRPRRALTRITRGELDGEIADERLERRLRRADERVVLEHALRAERRDRDDRRAVRHRGRGRLRRAAAGRARSCSASSPSASSSASSAGWLTPLAALWTSTSSGPSAATSCEHALGGDVAADERRLGAERAQLLGRLLGRAVAAEVADRDPLRAVACEAQRDRAPDAARPARDEDVHSEPARAAGRPRGRTTGSRPSRSGRADSRGPSSAFDDAWPSRSSRSICSSP